MLKTKMTKTTTSACAAGARKSNAVPSLLSLMEASRRTSSSPRGRTGTTHRGRLIISSSLASSTWGNSGSWSGFTCSNNPNTSVLMCGKELPPSDDVARRCSIFKVTWNWGNHSWRTDHICGPIWKFSDTLTIRQTLLVLLLNTQGNLPHKFSASPMEPLLHLPTSFKPFCPTPRLTMSLVITTLIKSQRQRLSSVHSQQLWCQPCKLLCTGFLVRYVHPNCSVNPVSCYAKAFRCGTFTPTAASTLSPKV